MRDEELLTKFKELAIDHYRAGEEGDNEIANLCVEEISSAVYGRSMGSAERH